MIPDDRSKFHMIYPHSSSAFCLYVCFKCTWYATIVKDHSQLVNLPLCHVCASSCCVQYSVLLFYVCQTFVIIWLFLYQVFISDLDLYLLLVDFYRLCIYIPASLPHKHDWHSYLYCHASLSKYRHYLHWGLRKHNATKNYT